MTTSELRLGENDAQMQKEERNKFYGDIISTIHNIFRRNDTSEIIALRRNLNNDTLFEKLESSINGEYDSEEIPLYITEGKFYIFGDEFTEDEILCIVKAYIEDDDIVWHMSLYNSLGGTEDDEDKLSFYMKLSNFPGNIINVIVSNIRNSPFCKRIRDEIDELLGM